MNTEEMIAAIREGEDHLYDSMILIDKLSDLIQRAEKSLSTLLFRGCGVDPDNEPENATGRCVYDVVDHKLVSLPIPEYPATCSGNIRPLIPGHPVTFVTAPLGGFVDVSGLSFGQARWQPSPVANRRDPGAARSDRSGSSGAGAAGIDVCVDPVGPPGGHDGVPCWCASWCIAVSAAAVVLRMDGPSSSSR